MARTRVLITVTTYPLPSNKYQELVCTAGVLENGDWIRIYPIPLSQLVKNRFRKYHWIDIDLEKRDNKRDFRPETHCPVNKDLRDLEIITDNIGTDNDWAERKKYCLNHTYTSMDALVKDAYDKKLFRSLAAFKPKEILDFQIIEDGEEWKPEWVAQMKQLCLDMGDDIHKIDIKKVPYKFKYNFLDSDNKKRSMMVEDWEIGQLYWNCLKLSNTKEEAIKKVKNRCFDDLAKKKDLYFFLGTTLQWHTRLARNPFVIVGLFYPPKVIQPSLF